MELAPVISTLCASETLAISSKAKEMKRRGIDVIALAAGEPDFDTPERIKQEANKALAEGFTKYTPTNGIPELKQAICDKLKKDNLLSYHDSEILVSCGAKHSVFNAVQAVASEGSAVMIPRPYWVSYTEMVKFARAVPLLVPSQKNNLFKVQAEELDRFWQPAARAIILNSPSNPTGSVYSEAELSAIAEFAIRRKLWVISDEIYEKIIYDNLKHISIAHLGPEIREQTIVINGLSKSHSMTGWRIGYAAGPKAVIERMGVLQGHTTSNACSFAQKAAVTALRECEKESRDMTAEFSRRRDAAIKLLDNIPQLSYIRPGGAFYFFIDITAYLGRRYGEQITRNSFAMCEYLLEEAKVAVIPGGAFGEDNFIRLSYATGLEQIQQGIHRIHEALIKLK